MAPRYSPTDEPDKLDDEPVEASDQTTPPPATVDDPDQQDGPEAD